MNRRLASRLRRRRPARDVLPRVASAHRRRPRPGRSTGGAQTSICGSSTSPGATSSPATTSIATPTPWSTPSDRRHAVARLDEAARLSRRSTHMAGRSRPPSGQRSNGREHEPDPGHPAGRRLRGGLLRARGYLPRSAQDGASRRRHQPCRACPASPSPSCSPATATTLPMVIGAAALGVAHRVPGRAGHPLRSRLKPEDASIGVVFPALFSIGVILISRYAGQVDLDLDCVLYGEIAYAPWDPLLFDLGSRDASISDRARCGSTAPCWS